MDEERGRKRYKTSQPETTPTSRSPSPDSRSRSASPDPFSASPRSRSGSFDASSRSPSPSPPPRSRSNSSLSPMDTNSPRAPKEDNPRSSARLQGKKTAEMNSLMEAANALGKNTTSSTAVDLTPLLLKPLAPGADNRGYVSTETRREMERTILKTKRKVSTSELPPVLSVMLSSKDVKDKGYARKSNRGREDGFRKGDDHTLTVNTGKPSVGKREPTDTPPPLSPNPYNTGEAIVPDLRYEQSHQSAYQLTRAPGTTVHAPTQANQVADTTHERHAAKKKGGFVYRHDTYTTSTMISGRPTGKDQEYELMESVYRRRKENPEKKNDKS